MVPSFDGVIKVNKSTFFNDLERVMKYGNYITMTNNQTWHQIRLICSSRLPPLTVIPIVSEALHEVLPYLIYVYFDRSAGQATNVLCRKYG